MKHLLTGLFILVLFSSCTKDKENETDFTTQNETEIQNYLLKNNLTAKRTASGLYYVVNNKGSGVNPAANSNVKVAYKGYFTNGDIFDQSSDAGISFGLQQVIKGWTEGIPYFKTGGSGVLLVPSHLGYGNKSTGKIPAGSVLIFDVTLIAIN